MNPPPAPVAAPVPARVPRLLANTGWNLAGQVLPLLVGIAVLPLLIRTLGLDRYGFITLVWVLVGYASIFDFGIGNVLVRVVAARLARGDIAGAHHVGRVGIACLGGLGLLIGSAFALGSGWLVGHVFKLPPELLGEAHHAMWLLAASIPFVMLTTGYTGVISAHQQFRGLNAVRAVVGVCSYVGPLVVASVVNRLDALVCFTLVLRALATLAHGVLAARSCGFHSQPVVPDRASSRELLRLGGWVAVSNFVGPMLSYLDRLLLGALVPMRMVAFYATPFDLLNRAMILPASMMGALFPSVAGVAPGSEEARQMLVRAARLLYVLMLPVIFSFIVLARPGLRLWLGEEFAAQAAPALQVLALGFFMNTLAQSPAMMIQAAGQPRLMSLLHLAEMPIFVGVLYGLTSEFGIVGTAAASTLRNAGDAVVVLILARQGVARGPIRWRGALAPAAMAAALFLAALWPSTLGQALAVMFVGLLVFAVFAWHFLLIAEERQRLLATFRSPAYDCAPP